MHRLANIINKSKVKYPGCEKYFIQLNTRLAKGSGPYTEFRAQRIIDKTPIRIPVQMADDAQRIHNDSISVLQSSAGNDQLSEDVTATALHNNSLTSLILEFRKIKKLVL